MSFLGRLRHRAKRGLGATARAIYWSLSPAERQFARIWPSIASVEGLLSSPRQERWLFEAALALPDGAVIVEVGSFKGRSTCCLAYGCMGTARHVFAIDTFEGNAHDFHRSQFFQEFSRNLQERGLSEHVTPIRSESARAAKEWDSPINLLFIDGSHRYEDVVADFCLFFPHVVRGGIVAVHDVVETWPGPLGAWHNIIKGQLRNIGYCGSLAYGTKPR